MTPREAMAEGGEAILTVTVYLLGKPVATPDYTHEAVLYSYHGTKYFYGHSVEEVLAEVLTYKLGKS